MKVILTRDVSGLGHKGDVVDVAPGYARNYLVPQRMAMKATAGSLKDAEVLQRARREALHRARQEAELIAQRLLGVRVVVAARSADEGKLFGSIGARDVAEAIKKFTGVEVEPSHVDLRTPIKEIGLHEVRVVAHPEVEFQLTLDVIPA
jgi:large subunit ribosomal protein L9